MNTNYTKYDIGGITKENRKLLSKLNRETIGPFNAAAAADILEISHRRAQRLLAYWLTHGWLSRVRHGIYITVPFDAARPAERREDTWIIANSLFSPCYIGGWSACEHWGLTEQIFSGIVVFSSHKLRDRRPIIQDTQFLIKSISENSIFGIEPVWRKEIKVNISDPSRTIVDILAYPELGGGLRHIAQVLIEYFSGEHRDDKKLINHISRLKKRSVSKRLGYLIEILEIDAPGVLSHCRKKISAGYLKLDPSNKSKGKLYRRWNIEINVNLNEFKEK